MSQKKTKFYDTCSLLIKVDRLFNDENEHIIISDITLNELENIKTSNRKDIDTKFAARRLLHLLDQNDDKYEVFVYKKSYSLVLESCFDITPDIKILSCVLYYQKMQDKDVIFVTNDLSLKSIAKLYLNNVESEEEEISDGYTGYIDAYMDDEEMSNFYSNPTKNLYNLEINQYINVYDNNKNLVDTLVWKGNGYRTLSFQNFESKWFGKIKPIKGDIYQSLLADSFSHNTITLVKGPAGSGKTYLSLGFLMYQLERGKIDKIIVFCNTVATKNSAKLGYLPGTRDEKLLDSQIGNLLISKLGGRIAVEQMISEEKLILLPLSDIRGYDTSGMNAGIYISEAQNLDISLMKLALQRVGSDSICIIDGDEKTQVDDISFAGVNNGMRRVSKVFRGKDIYGEVELKHIHRSKIATIAELM
jgi:predicted ribonuclease YlaK